MNRYSDLKNSEICFYRFFSDWFAWNWSVWIWWRKTDILGQNVFLFKSLLPKNTIFSFFIGKFAFSSSAVDKMIVFVNWTFSTEYATYRIAFMTPPSVISRNFRNYLFEYFHAFHVDFFVSRWFWFDPLHPIYYIRIFIHIKSQTLTDQYSNFTKFWNSLKCQFLFYLLQQSIQLLW